MMQRCIGKPQIAGWREACSHVICWREYHLHAILGIQRDAKKTPTILRPGQPGHCLVVASFLAGHIGVPF